MEALGSYQPWGEARDPQAHPPKRALDRLRVPKEADLMPGLLRGPGGPRASASLAKVRHRFFSGAPLRDLPRARLVHGGAAGHVMSANVCARAEPNLTLPRNPLRP